MGAILTKYLRCRAIVAGLIPAVLITGNVAAADSYKTGGVWNGVKWEGEFELQRTGQLTGAISLPDVPDIGKLPAVGEIQGNRVTVRVFQGDTQILTFSGTTDGRDVAGHATSGQSRTAVHTKADFQTPPLKFGK